MDYNHVNSFLEKFKKLLLNKEVSSVIIAETISKHISTTLSINDIRVKGTTIHVKSSPMLQGEIMIHKQAILSDLNKFIPQGHFKDIRN